VEKIFGRGIGLLVEPLLHQRPYLLERVQASAPRSLPGMLAVRRANFTIPPSCRQTLDEMTQCVTCFGSRMAILTHLEISQRPLGTEFRIGTEWNIYNNL
jgi:hypothetical protein